MRLVEKTPVLATIFLGSASVGQLIRMWTYHTAAGQSLVAWCSVNLALLLWFNYYRVMLPDQVLPRASTAVEIALNTGVILSVIWFRYLA